MSLNQPIRVYCDDGTNISDIQDIYNIAYIIDIPNNGTLNDNIEFLNYKRT